MPWWIQEEVYKNQDVFIIGGGSSLVDFDWQRLKGRDVIGINWAFQLGSDICPICFFSDLRWYEKYFEELEAYSKCGGTVITHCPTLNNSPVEWLDTIQRHKDGLHKDGIGYGNGSGASAINLALLMGAKRVFLLGFDGKLGEGNRVHWHDNQIEKPTEEVYDKFDVGFKKVAEQLEDVYPGTEVINLNEDSTIEHFPKLDMEEFI